ncbi:MAG: phosphodiester glycosidase family protein [Synechococcales cyanobacterium CRU_2_2]|nr:phosphodiester glycosidase family protein [Synechococcales cyanobacterium CRU_2_2]
MRWQQAYVRVGGAEFPVTQLRLDLQQVGLDLRPVWPQGNGMLGIARLDETLMARGAIAGLNAGFFNRNNKAPLAALRSRGEWLSGPILDRGAIGWNEAGQVIIDRLTLTETLQPSLPSDQNPGTLPRESLESIALNSGYLKAGFSRYTAAWGLTYTPFTDNEVLIYVQGGQVIEQRQGGKAGTETFPLSLPGQAGGSDLKNYLLVARSNRSGAAKLPVGTALELTQHWSSSGLARSPNLLGAGPLLIQNRRIVLDAAAEGFSSAFIREQAPRSVAAVFADGSLSLITVHERVGGKGPTLAELARLLQSMEAVQALNLDGGSSTQLFLGGQIINRSPRSAARVHSGLGLFLKRP